MTAFTVEDLLKECKKQILLGNGKKRIYLSDDDEGNGYHEMYYGFTYSEEDIKTIKKYSCDRLSDERTEEVVVLG